MAKHKNKLEEICIPKFINRILTFETFNFMIGDEICKIVSVESNPHKILVRRSGGVKTYNQSELIKLLKL